MFPPINTRLEGKAADFLVNIPDDWCQLILTDPPYDLGREEQIWYQEQFQRITKGWIIVFGKPENQWCGGVADQYLFWIKPISTKNTSKSYSRFVEMIFVYGRGHWDSSRHWSQYTNVFQDLVDDTKLHQFRKPPSLIKRLIRNHTQPNDIILDPFAGSGVVGLLAEQLHRRYLLIDRVR